MLQAMGLQRVRHNLANEQQREMVFKMTAFMKQKQDVIKRNTRDKNIRNERYDDGRNKTAM